MAFIQYNVILSHMIFSVIASAQKVSLLKSQAIVLQSEEMALYVTIMCKCLMTRIILFVVLQLIFKGLMFCQSIIV